MEGTLIVQRKGATHHQGKTKEVRHVTATQNPFTTSEEHQQFRQSIRDFIERETSREMDRHLDETGEFPYELAKKMADAGFYGVPFPEEYGGQGGSALEFAILCDELAYGSEAAAACFLMPVFFAGEMLLLNGSDEQRAKWLPEIISGNLRGCFALTEPNAGSDAAAITTNAALDGDEWVLNGQKTLISGVDVADYIMCVTRTGPREPKPYSNITILMVDRKAPGITINKIEKVGSRAVGLFEIFFDDVRIPRGMVIGGEEAVGNGWGQMWMSLDMERIMVATLYTAIARKAFDDALEHAKQREQFGQPIGRFQAIQHQLANMKIHVDAAEMMAYRAAWLKDQGMPCSMEGAEAKTFATEIALRVCLDGMQVLGGWGYTMEYDMQRYARAAMLGPIGMGTNHIQKTIIAKLLGLF